MTFMITLLKLGFFCMENRKTSQNIDVKYLVQVILRHWLLILFSLMVCIAVAIVYLKGVIKNFSCRSYRSSGC
jgi:hypothetical protein